MDKIRAQLKALPEPALVNRDNLAEIFHVGPRRAQQLMKQFGCYRVGSAYVARASDILEAIDRLESEGVFAAEIKRRDDVNRQIQEAVRRQASRQRLIMPPPPIGRNGLPEGVELRAGGELVFHHDSPEHVLGQIEAFVRIASEDFEYFEELLAGACPDEDDDLVAGGAE